MLAAGDFKRNVTDSSNGPILLPTVTPEDAQKTFGINHRGFVVMGIDDIPGQKAYYIHLEAKSGKGDKVQHFLRDINSGVDQEPLNARWFALRHSLTTSGIFGAFLMQRPGTPMTEVLVVGIFCKLGFCMTC